ncbi:hypothetical protein HGRIS_006704 [Hohenbuehelia grisea]|uniref:RNA helicase n=1 Tax=Hohenbuehelia grisea TaxID=104357 RepID=A0ABR3JAG4_9AGAR
MGLMSSRRYYFSRSVFDTDHAHAWQHAITSVTLHQSPVPYLVSGPPGTGKTRTMVELVVQLTRLQPEACILLCAPSNPATDTLVLRLSETLQPNEMLRLNDEHRTFAEVPSKIMPYCYIENDHFALPAWRDLMRYRVVVTSCLDASILVRARCTNRALGIMEAEVSSGLHHLRGVPDVSPHWTHLLVDEAAQGSEPELLVPISVVLPFSPEEYASKDELPLQDMHMLSMPQLILCGDYNQLGPIVLSEMARNAELDISLLERLFERPLYANHAHARSRLAKRGLISHFERDSESAFVPFANLIKNYRSHPAILMPPSGLFYEDSLEPQAENGQIVWSGLQNTKLPLLFIGHNHPEDSNDERASWFNTGEIEAIVKAVTSLMQEKDACDPPLRQEQIGVMAPWREQVWKIRERLRMEMMGGVDVGTVEDYQGRENRVIIISCVRSNERFLEEDGKKALGFVHERKRMNVAITRAKELLVVIGNGSVLQKCTYWKGFLQFALRHKLYVGPKLKMYLDGAFISRLETEFMSRLGDELDLDAEDKGVIQAGGMVRELLKGWM